MGAAVNAVATFAHAPAHVRDAATLLGSVIDVGLPLAAVRGAPVRMPAATGAAVEASPEIRPAVRFAKVTPKGQAGGVSATLTSDILNTGSRASRRLRPPGWSGNGNAFNEARGHLLANMLGGTGREMQNLATLTQKPTNSPQMRNFEDEVARRLRNGEVIDYQIKPLYFDSALPPAFVLLTALGDREPPSAKIIQNPAGTRR